MAKELPYFQFEPAEYLTGDISFCSISAQGLFTNLCSYYWQRSCELTKDQFLRRLNYPKELQELIDENVIEIDGNKIIIKFLDVQYKKATSKSETNKANGSKGGRPRKKNPKETETKPKLNPTESESKGIREEEIKEEEIKEDEMKEEEIKNALTFLQTNASSQLESFTMQNKKSVHKWQDMLDSFNDKIDIEVSRGKIEFESSQLMPRLRSYCRSWISNQVENKSTSGMTAEQRKEMMIKKATVL